MKTKVEALCGLMREARSEKVSTAAAKRIVRAAKILALDIDETRKLLWWLDYCDYETGNPHSKLVERVWP